MGFCEKVRKETDFYWEASFYHPFVQGIADGSLPAEKFKFYMLQDAYYLKHYTKVLVLQLQKRQRMMMFNIFCKQQSLSMMPSLSCIVQRLKN